MAIKALSLKPIEYFSKFDDAENPEDRTVFLVRGLTRLEWLEVENSYQSSEIAIDSEEIKTISQNTNIGTSNKLLLDFGLTGWRNFTDDSGKEVPFSNASKDMIPREVREELCSEISKLTSISTAQRKN